MENVTLGSSTELHTLVTNVSASVPRYKNFTCMSTNNLCMRNIARPTVIPQKRNSDVASNFSKFLTITLSLLHFLLALSFFFSLSQKKSVMESCNFSDYDITLFVFLRVRTEEFSTSRPGLCHSPI